MMEDWDSRRMRLFSVSIIWSLEYGPEFKMQFRLIWIQGRRAAGWAAFDLSSFEAGVEGDWFGEWCFDDEFGSCLLGYWNLRYAWSSMLDSLCLLSLPMFLGWLFGSIKLLRSGIGNDAWGYELLFFRRLSVLLGGLWWQASSKKWFWARSQVSIYSSKSRVSSEARLWFLAVKICFWKISFTTYLNPGSCSWYFFMNWKACIKLGVIWGFWPSEPSSRCILRKLVYAQIFYGCEPNEKRFFSLVCCRISRFSDCLLHSSRPPFIRNLT